MLLTLSRAAATFQLSKEAAGASLAIMPALTESHHGPALTFPAQALASVTHP